MDQSLSPLQHLPLSPIRLIASDVDGTLTDHEQFSSQLLTALEQLQRANIPLLLVTGRSAGWVDALRYYLPVTGAIAENGGVYFPKHGPYELLSPIEDVATHRQTLTDAFQQLQEQYPELQAATDNHFRLTDWTFDVEGLAPQALGAIARQCQIWGWDFTFSSVQCHILPAQQNKATGIQRVLSQHFPDLDLSQVVTIGDSPNDEAMFNPDLFPNSVGVANLRPYCDRLRYLPQYVTEAEGIQGFCELADLFLQPVLA